MYIVKVEFSNGEEQYYSAWGGIDKAFTYSLSKASVLSDIEKARIAKRDAKVELTYWGIKDFKVSILKPTEFVEVE